MDVHTRHRGLWAGVALLIVVCFAMNGNLSSANAAEDVKAATAGAAGTGIAKLNATYAAERSEISATGSGFPANAKVTLLAQFSDTTARQLIDASASGQFQAVVAVRDGYVGAVQLTATAPTLKKPVTSSSVAPATATPVSATSSSTKSSSATTPATKTAGTSSALPQRIIGDYWTTWGKFPVSQLKSQAPGYNVHYASFALSAAPGTGKLQFDPGEGGDSLAADIAADKAKGSLWMLSVGGASDGGIKLTSAAQAEEAVSSLIPIIDKYRFQGIDWDLESPATSFANDAITAASQQLKAHYGKGFVIQFTAAPGVDIRRDMVAQHPEAFDLLGYMFYCDNFYYNDSQARSEIIKRIDAAVAAGVPASKLLVGAMVGSNEAHAKASVYVDTFNELKTKYSDLRGMFSWETTIDRDSGWQFVTLASKS